MLSDELREHEKFIISEAKKYNLDFDPIEFLELDANELNSIAAYNGFAVRYPHWRWGMEFNSLKKKYSYGLAKIYELVINNNPVYAYLLNTNAIVDQKLVMAHVCGHADFFKNNMWFSKTSKNMLDQFANHASRIQRIMDVTSENEVSNFIEVCLSLENLIDVYSSYSKTPLNNKEEDSYSPIAEENVPRFKSNEYMDSYINDKEYLAKESKKLKEAATKKIKFPETPEQDILLFLINNAPLLRWQKDILGMIREEAYYFAPQRMTKIINEAWATYWHSKMMTEKLLSSSEVIDYCDVHSGVLSAGNGFNPYKVGLSIFRSIEDRWNRGAFGSEYEECDEEDVKKNWNKKLNLGTQKIFQVRTTYNDVNFIDDFLTEEVCKENKLFAFKKEEYTETVIKDDFKSIKKELLSQLTNNGNPIIKIIEGNYKNRHELLLQHYYDGKELDVQKAKITMESLFKVWTRPVSIRTTLNDKEVVLKFDGNSHFSEPV